MDFEKGLLQSILRRSFIWYTAGDELEQERVRILPMLTQ
jgi:hypothetical protein